MKEVYIKNPLFIQSTPYSNIFNLTQDKIKNNSH